MGNPTCNPSFKSYCEENYGNGHCDQGCNNAPCNWDGNDCNNPTPMNSLKGTMVIFMMSTKDDFLINANEFLRNMGLLLNVVIKIKKDANGNFIIKPWSSNGLHREKRSIINRIKREIVQTEGIEVHLELDSSQCRTNPSMKCLTKIESAVQIIAAQKNQSWSHGGPTISRVSSEDVDGPGTDETTSYQTMYIVVACGGILVLAILVIVVLSRKKVARGITWFPEGFFSSNNSSKAPGPRSSKRRVPDGEEKKGNQMPQFDGLTGATTPPWNDDEDESKAKRIKMEKDCEVLEQNLDGDKDQRQWTQQHLTAANISNDSMLALTPPDDSDHTRVRDIDVRGPDGFTPLMLAAFRGGGYDVGDNESSGSGGSGSSDSRDSENCVDYIQALLTQGASVDLATDRTGETALHLSSRYARSDAAKILLDAGADPNQPDIQGRTPLHSAIAADAQGVFQILLRNRSTNLNARMEDGATPLIMAARLAVEGMVEDLISADADINSADEYGKTALHWASAVNNYTAAQVLLQHGANRDAQDHKDETPLFLAAREGAYESAKILLEHYANRDITDHMDRLPRDIASERMHGDILQLLDEYCISSPMSLPTSPNGLHFMQQKPSKMKQKKSKHNNGLGTPLTHNGVLINGVHQKRTKSKKKSSKGNGHSQISEGSIGTVSPGNSIASPLDYERTPPPYDSMYGNGQNFLQQQTLQQSIEELQKNCAMNQVLDVQNHNDNNYRDLRNCYDKTLMEQEYALWHQGHQNSQMNPQHSQPSNIPTPPQNIPSNPSPLGKISPSKPPKNLPTSPTHIQAMQQRARQERANGSPPNKQTDLTCSFQNKNHSETMPFTTFGRGMQKLSTPQQPMYLEQFPTPPSTHSMGSPPQIIHQPVLPDHYLTPSPDSPGQWSSSSPHSAHSDWSEGISSPDQNVRTTLTQPPVFL